MWLRRSGHGLLRIINDILDLSKLEANRLEPESIPYQPGAVIKYVVDLLRLGDLSPRVHLHFDLQNVPPAVLGDPTRVRQVLLNLVGNAIKFTAEGEVAVRASWSNNVLEISVIDTGSGISAEQLERLFEPFIQGDGSTSRRHGGTGLGLAICRRLVELMGGTLSVDSIPGLGGTFRFTVQAPRTEELPQSTTRSLAARPDEQQLDALVLLVDDNPVNLAVAEAMLVRLGCRVTAVTGGEAALHAIEHTAFDLVLMDFQMPGIDGFEATRRLRARGHTLPVVALTAGVTSDQQARCLEVGMNAVLTKPTTLQGLYRAVATWSGASARVDSMGRGSG